MDFGNNFDEMHNCICKKSENPENYEGKLNEEAQNIDVYIKPLILMCI